MLPKQLGQDPDVKSSLFDQRGVDCCTYLRILCLVSCEWTAAQCTYLRILCLISWEWTAARIYVFSVWCSWEWTAAHIYVFSVCAAAGSGLLHILSLVWSSMSSLIPPDLVTWILGRDLMASDAEFVEKAIEVSFFFFSLKLSVKLIGLSTVFRAGGGRVVSQLGLLM